jgi:hypothetical protein
MCWRGLACGMEWGLGGGGRDGIGGGRGVEKRGRGMGTQEGFIGGEMEGKWSERCTASRGPERTGHLISFRVPVRQWGLCGAGAFAHSRRYTRRRRTKNNNTLHTSLPCSDNSSINPSPIATPTRKLHKIRFPICCRSNASHDECHQKITLLGCTHMTQKAPPAWVLCGPVRPKLASRLCYPGSCWKL